MAKLALTFDFQGLVEQFRLQVLSEDAETAHKNIRQYLLGDGEGSGEAATQILMGTHNVVEVGHMTLDVIPQDPPADTYLRMFKEVYAGRVLHNRQWIRPVRPASEPSAAARLRAFHATEHLLVTAGARYREENEDGVRALRAWSKRVAEDDIHTGQMVLDVSDIPYAPNYFVFEFCSPLPSWYEGPYRVETPTEAVELLRSQGRLPAREKEIEYGLVKDRRQYEDMFVRTRSRDLRVELEDVFENYRDFALEVQEAEYRHKILEQAKDDLFPMAIGDVTYNVPRAPFERWALRGTGFLDKAPAWTIVAPCGWKMTLDDPNHTDWMLGAGIPMRLYGRREFDDVAYKHASEVQNRYYCEDDALVVILDAGERVGTVGVDIAVLPDLGPAHVAALNGKAIITETGGAMAHLAVVGLTRNITIVRVPGAREQYVDGMQLLVDPTKRRIKVLQKE